VSVNVHTGEHHGEGRHSFKEDNGMSPIPIGFPYDHNWDGGHGFWSEAGMGSGMMGMAALTAGGGAQQLDFQNVDTSSIIQVASVTISPGLPIEAGVAQTITVSGHASQRIVQAKAEIKASVFGLQVLDKEVVVPPKFLPLNGPFQITQTITPPSIPFSGNVDVEVDLTDKNSRPIGGVTFSLSF